MTRICRTWIPCNASYTAPEVLNECSSCPFPSSTFAEVEPCAYSSRFDMFEPAAVAVVAVVMSVFRPTFQVMVRVACCV